MTVCKQDGGRRDKRCGGNEARWSFDTSQDHMLVVVEDVRLRLCYVSSRFEGMSGVQWEGQGKVARARAHYESEDVEEM